MFCPMLSLVVSACTKWDVNRGSQSDIILDGTPNHGNRCLRYKRATPSPVIVMWHGRKIAALEHPWSITVRITSYPLALGSWVTRSRATTLNGRIDRSTRMR